jgi:asparagine synthase (glutamine-hydrolysing)
MCGISGIINSKGFQLQTLREMTDIIHHRGPDDEGFVSFNGDNKSICYGDMILQRMCIVILSIKANENINDNINHSATIVFGHRRLSILELSPAGHQPLCDSN